MTFRLKTIVGIALIQAIMLALLAWHNLGVLSSSNENELINRAHTTTELFATACKNAVLSSDLATLESFVRDLLKKPGIIYARIIDQDGLELAATGDTDVLTKPFRQDNSYAEVDDRVFDTSSRILVQGTEFGRVEIGFSVAELESILNSAKSKSLSLSIGALILCAIFSYILGSFLTRAIDHLRTGSENISAGNFGYQIEIKGRDELAAAADAFNSMSKKLEQLDEERNQAEEEMKLLNELLDQKVRDRTEQLEEAYADLKATQSQMLQQEKMASIGQLAAGVAHEINNPMGYITSNLSTLGKYTEKLTEFLQQQNAYIDATGAESEEANRIITERKRLKVDVILEDLDDLIRESLDGADRVKEIVLNLKNFSRIDEEQKYQDVNLNDCLESTLKIIENELKYKTTVSKDYGELPLIRCRPMELNQVFLNILVNAAQAIEEHGEIKLRTQEADNNILVFISDTGVGIQPESLHRIFEPFFTTKEVGKGTGLGMSIAYDIIKKHQGDIHVDSEPGVGTTFRISIPITRTEKDTEKDTTDQSHHLMP